MKIPDNISRRQFLQRSGKAGTLLALTSLSNISAFVPVQNKTAWNISIFSKHLQWMDYPMMAKTAAKIGFDGIDLTVRPGGHVLPENVEKDLPRAYESVKKANIDMPMITTSIKNASDPISVKILETAAQLGVQYYRMGWFDYDENVSIQKNHENFKLTLEGLAELNEKLGIRGSYQNHAGDAFGSAIWDLGMILNEIDSDWLGCQYDIRHATVEGAYSWPQGLKYIAPHINTIDIKDFYWVKSDEGWEVQNVPLGEGAVDFTQYFKLLNELEVTAPVSIHYEYDLGGAEHGNMHIDMEPDQVIDIIKKDLKYLRNILGK